MSAKLTSVWILVYLVFANCRIAKLDSIEGPYPQLAGLVAGLNENIFLLEQEILQSYNVALDTLADVKELRPDVCSVNICSGSTTDRSFLMTKLDEILSSAAQEMEHGSPLTSVLTEVQRTIEDQRNNLDDLQSAIHRIPSVDTNLYTDLQHFRDEFQYEPPSTTTSSARPKNCLEAKQAGYGTGITTLYLNLKQWDVWCDQDTEGGGWTVMIKRQTQTPQQDFHQDLTAYRHGFGNLTGEHWLGLEAIHELTLHPNELLVAMAIDEEKAVSYYGSFKVDGGDSSYKLHVSEFSEARSTGGDSLSYHNNQRFTTYEHDQDGAWGGNCADWSGGGGGWFDHCFVANPTGLHSKGIRDRGESDHYLEWRSWQGYYGYLTDLTMMIRQKQD